MSSMNSINYNPFAADALYQGGITQRHLTTINKIINTGRTVNDPQDDPTRWVLANRMRNNGLMYETLDTIMPIGMNKLQNASGALKNVSDNLVEIGKTLLQMDGKDVEGIRDLQQAIKGYAENIKKDLLKAEDNGFNILLNEGAGLSISSGYRNTKDGVVIDTIDVTGKQLNFGKADAKGYDLKSGQLASVFAQAGKEIDLISKSEDYVTAKKEFENNSNQENLATKETALRTELKKISIMEFADIDITEVNPGAMKIVIEEMSNKLNESQKNTQSASVYVGSSYARVENQRNALKQQIASNTANISSLIDADIKAAKAKEAAIRMQEQLNNSVLIRSLATRQQGILALFQAI